MATNTPGKAELKVDGVFYGGWKRVRVNRSIEQMAGAFELEISERWPGHPESSPIRPGQACELLLDGERVIYGYVDVTSPDYDEGRHTIRVAGRDKTADLVDCSAIYKTGQWKGAKLDRIAKDLIKDFSIELVVETDLGEAFSSFALQEGETVFEALERAARQRAVLLTSDADGRLVMTRAGKTRVDGALVEGRNIKAARGEFSHRDRFSRYVVKGHGKLGANGEFEHAAPSATVVDEIIARHRPLIVISETHGKASSLKARAEWERNVRRGRSARASLTVQGWRNAGRSLWAPNQLVDVHSPWLWISQPTEMLIAGCVYTLDDERGTLTELIISRPEAFDLIDGVGTSKLFGKMRSKEQRERHEKGEDWSMM